VFEGYNPQEPQEIRLNMQHIEQPAGNTVTTPPSCYLYLSQTNLHTVNLTISVSTMEWFYQNQNFETWLSIDSQTPEKLSGILYSGRAGMFGPAYSRQYNVTLSGLEDGSHFIEIRVGGEYFSAYGLEGGNYDCEGNVSFILDNKFPTIGNISIKNTSYYENDLELSCATSEPCSWIAYSLDNQANVTISGTNETQQAKTNLTDLSEGRHTITIYASDVVGNTVATETITFTVEPYPTTAIVTAVLAAIIVTLSVLAFRRHRKTAKMKQ
jgi:hypothetical protein